MLLITICLIILSIKSTDAQKTESYFKANTPFTIIQFGENQFLAFLRNETDNTLKQISINKELKRYPFNDRPYIVEGSLNDTGYNTIENKVPDAGIYPSHTNNPDTMIL